MTLKVAVWSFPVTKVTFCIQYLHTECMSFLIQYLKRNFSLKMSLKGFFPSFLGLLLPLVDQWNTVKLSVETCVASPACKQNIHSFMFRSYNIPSHSRASTNQQESLVVDTTSGN